MVGKMQLDDDGFPFMNWQRFGANSPHFYDIGLAMHDKYHSLTNAGLYEERIALFREGDIETYIQWQWHQFQHQKCVINDLNNKIIELKQEIVMIKNE